MPLPPPERDLELLVAACGALTAGDLHRADSLAHALIPELPARVARPPITPAAQVEVMRRDRYTCRYCGARTVPAAILRAVALAWPDCVPYQANWRTDSTHPLFAARTATFDHLRPHAHGGLDVTADNLVTACWPCNLQKSDFSVERLGWTIQDIDASIDWDGLVHAYPALWERARPNATPSQVRYHSRWLRLLQG
jgi:hypothetical protein